MSSSKRKRKSQRSVSRRNQPLLARTANGAKIFESRNRVTKIQYADGSARTFVYTGSGVLAQIGEPDGKQWRRRVSENTWRTTSGEEWEGTIEVVRSGNVSYTAVDGHRRVFMNTGVMLNPISPAQLLDSLETNLQRLDLNGDGKISRKELDIAIQNPELSGRDAELVVFLRLCYDHIRLMSTDDDNQWKAALKRMSEMLKGWRGADGITYDSLQRIEEMVRSNHKVSEKFADLVEAQVPFHKLNQLIEWFPEIDGNEDEFLSKREIDRALGKLELDETERLILSYMSSAFFEIAGEDKRISLQDLKMHVLCMKQRTAYLAKAFDMVLGTACGRSAHSNLSLYADEFDPLKSIKPAAIRQGVIGDCIFLAILASVAEIRPELIERSIFPHDDKSFTVVFPNAFNEPITVPYVTDAELALYAGACPLGLWPAVLEKACGIYCSRTFQRRLRRGQGEWIPKFWKSEIPSENASGKGGLDLFGKTERIMLHGSKADTVRAMVIEAMEARDPIVCARQLLPTFLTEKFRDKYGGDNAKDKSAEKSKGKSKNNSKDNSKRTSTRDEIFPNHAYAVIAFDEEKDIVKLYNPWGHNKKIWGITVTPVDTGSGELELTMDEFAATMTTIFRTRISAFESTFQ